MDDTAALPTPASSPLTLPAAAAHGVPALVRVDGGELAVPDSAGLPTIFERARKEKLLRDFTAEFLPVGPTETVLVVQLAGHAAAFKCWDAGSEAALREAARALRALGPEITLNARLEQDAVVAGAMSAETTERCERFSLLRSRAFLRTLDKLRELQAARRCRSERSAVLPPLGFDDEAACEEYLANRLRQGHTACPQCGGASQGCFVRARGSWECRACGKQHGLRAGTVMARSPVPLRTWFDAVRRVLWRPTIGAAELAPQLGVERIATVRSILGRIRTAMAADDANRQLAGLEQYYCRAATSDVNQVSPGAEPTEAHAETNQHVIGDTDVLEFQQVSSTQPESQTIDTVT